MPSLEQKSPNLIFARNLVKGKIAETIFAQMLRETRQFTVLEFGYEKIIPELVQQGYKENNATLQILKTAPDFAVIDHNTREVRLVEVKYLRKLDLRYVLIDAKRMTTSWNPSWLFIACHDGFYFDEVQRIVINKGEIDRFNHPQISIDIQNQYLEILNDFKMGSKNISRK